MITRSKHSPRRYPIRDKAILTKPSVSLGGNRPADATVTLAETGPEHLKVHAARAPMPCCSSRYLTIPVGSPPPITSRANLRADIGLMAIPLPAGNYDVSLDFRPNSVQIGAIISIVALIVTLICWLSGFSAPAEPQNQFEQL